MSLVFASLKKTADILRRHHWFSRKMTSEERLQKYPGLGSAFDCLKRNNQQELYYLDLTRNGSDTLSVTSMVFLRSFLRRHFAGGIAKFLRLSFGVIRTTFLKISLHSFACSYQRTGRARSAPDINNIATWNPRFVKVMP